MRPIEITPPLSQRVAEALRMGDEVSISGIIYTARDAAHQRLIDLIKEGKEVPFPLKDQIIYYAAPAPARPGKILGSCGPTTSSRLDDYTLPLLVRGLRGMMGKGQRSEKVREMIGKYKAIYFLTLGGAGAYLSQKVKRAEVIAFSDLGPEAVYKLWVKKFPAIVGIDARGEDLYRSLWLER